MKIMLPIAAAMSLISASSVIFAAEKGEKSSSEMPPQMPPAEVSFVTTEAKDVPIRAEGLGFTESSLVSEVRARVTAFILERHFAEGNLVKQGDLLYTLESESFEADVQVVEASIASSEARLKLATLELDRLASLQQSDAVAQVDVDKAQAEADQARASLRLYKAELNKAKLSLSYTKVYAPITGLAGKTLFDTGALVEENDTLIEITRIDPIYITFGVSEKEYLQWKNDRTAGGVVRPTEGSNRFEIFVQDGSVLTGGTLNYEDPSFALATGTTRLRLSFPNPDGK
ncbi:MAG: efflux RND transporter periplasmic adaptor subunit, partial [Candidatus Sumerlaeia bacterium]|nr:efflux RND transporter periplasmic adaptor subunit [Candidatus Sumerlaeia bacterium]